MRVFSCSILLLLVCYSCQQNSKATVETEVIPAYAMVIHGGAGTISRDKMTPEMDSAYRVALHSALDAGEKILKAGGSSLDAVIATIQVMEESPLFNAGVGAVFTHEGKNELDASIMDGSNLMAGSVGGVTIVKSPIALARAVMEKSEHVLLTGKGAETFAIEQGLDTVPNSYFFTQRRWDALQAMLQEEASVTGYKYPGKGNDYKFGTVGCVALDKNGNIAAGTSTGGMTNKRYNRFGDSPIIGAGTYASNATCGVSCTGHGEFFIRYAVAHDVSAMMEYKGVSVSAAGDWVINEKLKKAGGEGGLIALDAKGNIAMPFNSEGMYRGFAKPGQRKVLIYGDEQ